MVNIQRKYTFLFCVMLGYGAVSYPAQPDPVVQAFLDSLATKGGTPLYKLPVEEARNVFDSLQAGPVQKLPAEIQSLSIPVGPRGNVDVRIIRPQGSRNTVLPAVIYMHGGGWVFGNKVSHDRLVREIANGAQAAVVFVDYGRAPENQYPSIHEEGYAVAQWVAEHGKEINIDTSRMAIIGDSVGGLVATAITMMAKERGGPRFIYQVLFYPVTDAQFDTGSYKQFSTGYFLEREGMKWFWDSYVPDRTIRKKPWVAPLRASLDQLKNLPPALIIVGEYDVLRDEGEAYAHKLMQAGVPVIGCRYLGMIHDFVMLNSIAQAPGVRAAIDQANGTLRRAFARAL